MRKIKNKKNIMMTKKVGIKKRGKRSDEALV